MNPNINSKKIVLFLCLFFLFLGGLALAQDPCPEYKIGNPIVTCGNSDDRCTFDDFICLVNNIIGFTILSLVPPLAIIWFAIGGITMMTANGDPSKIETGKKMLTYGVIGVIIAYGAYFIVYEFVSYLTGGNPWPLNFLTAP